MWCAPLWLKTNTCTQNRLPVFKTGFRKRQKRTTSFQILSNTLLLKQVFTANFKSNASKSSDNYFTQIIQAHFLTISCPLLIFMQLGEEVKSYMRESLQTYYGVNLDDSYNRAVTDAWDKAQDRVRRLKTAFKMLSYCLCCAIDNITFH